MGLLSWLTGERPPAGGRVDIAGPRHKADPFPFYARLRAEEPVSRVTLPDGQAAWLVARYDDVAAVLRDERFVKDRLNALTPGPRAPGQLAKQPWVPGFARPLTRNMLDLDPPDHTRLRALVAKAFTPRLVEGMRPRAQASRLMPRLTAPTVAVSLLLLGVGTATAWYSVHTQQRTSDVLAQHVAGVRAAEELEIGLREVRSRLTRYLVTGERKHLDAVPAMHAETDYWLDVAERSALTGQEQEWARRTRGGYAHFFTDPNRVTRDLPPVEQHGQILQLIDNFQIDRLSPHRSHAT